MVERTGWRDEALARQIGLWDIDDSLMASGYHREVSARHRTWGPELAAIDADMVFTEYRSLQPVAVTEFKFCHSKPICLEENYQARAVGAMADAMNVPAFLVVYQREPVWAFRIFPLNDRGTAALGADQKSVFERSYVRWMYEVRGYPMTEALEAHIGKFPGGKREDICPELQDWRPVRRAAAA